MPRYFFHVYDELDLADEDGIELDDPEAARSAALAGARAMMCDQMSNGRLNLEHRIEVVDEAGRAILNLRFGDAVRIVVQT